MEILECFYDKFCCCYFRRRHASHLRQHRERQELREDSLFGEEHVVSVANFKLLNEKIFNEKILTSSCCGAGTAADTESSTNMIASQLELHRLSTNRVVPVPCAATLLKQYLFRYQGHVSAALVLGGVDSEGPHIYSIHPHGSTDRVPYATMGSGSLAAMSVFESRWKPDMEVEEGKKLVRDAIAAGIFNDLGSGSNVDLCVIKKGSVDYLRGYELSNQKGERQLDYTYRRGATHVKQTRTIPIEIVHETTVEAMDTN